MIFLTVNFPTCGCQVTSQSFLEQSNMDFYNRCHGGLLQRRTTLNSVYLIFIIYWRYSSHCICSPCVFMAEKKKLTTKNNFCADRNNR